MLYLGKGNNNDYALSCHTTKIRKRFSNLKNMF